MKIAILKRDALGDTLLIDVLVQALHEQFPKVKIDIYTRAFNAQIFQNNPFVNRVVVFPRSKAAGKKQYMAMIKQFLIQSYAKLFTGYDVAIAAGCHASTYKTAKRLTQFGAKRNIAFIDDERAKTILTDPLSPPPQGEMHEKDRMLQLLTPLGIDVSCSKWVPRYYPLEEQLAAGENWLKQNLNSKPYLIIGTCTGKPKSRLSIEQIERLAQWAFEQHQLQTLLMHTPSETEQLQPLLNKNLAHIHPFDGDIQTAVGLIWNAKTTVMPDGGLMHIAATSPGDVLGLFGNTDSVMLSPKQWSPCGNHSETIASDTVIPDEPIERFQQAIDRLLATKPR